MPGGVIRNRSNTCGTSLRVDLAGATQRDHREHRHQLRVAANPPVHEAVEGR